MRLVEYEQPTSLPVPKVQAATQAGVAVTALMTVLALSGIIVPDNISGSAETAINAIAILVPALQTVVMFVAAYFKKDKKPVEVVDAIKEQARRG